MSNLQVLARRCPVMGQAMTIQAAKNGNSTPSGVFGGACAYRSFSGKAKLHTSRVYQATVDHSHLRHRDTCKGTPIYELLNNTR